VLLAISFAVLLTIGGVRRWATRHDRGAGSEASPSLRRLKAALGVQR
jgi:hypothetical protein